MIQLSKLSDTFTSVAARFPASFAGVEIRNGSIVVYSVAPDASMRAALDSIVPQPAHLDYRNATNTWRELTALTREITEDKDAWAASGVNLVQWGPDTSANKVEVFLEDYSPEAASRLYRAYGDGKLLVSAAEMGAPTGGIARYLPVWFDANTVMGKS